MISTPGWLWFTTHFNYRPHNFHRFFLFHAPSSINQHQDSRSLGGFNNIFKLSVSRYRRFELGLHVRHGFEEAQQQTALDRVIHILRQRPARRQRRPRIQLGRHDADDVAPLIHQRPARIARLHRRADLKIPRVIPRAGQRRDFPLGQLGREPLQAESGKPTVATVPPRCAARLVAMGNGENFPSAFSKARSLAAST